MNISTQSFKSHISNISVKETFHIIVSVVSLACIEASLQTLAAAVSPSFTHAADCLIVIPPRDVAHATKGGWLRLISAIIPYSSEIQLQPLTHQRFWDKLKPDSDTIYMHASVLLFLQRQGENRVLIDKVNRYFLRADSTFRFSLASEIYITSSCRTSHHKCDYGSYFYRVAYCLSFILSRLRAACDLQKGFGLDELDLLTSCTHSA